MKFKLNKNKHGFIYRNRKRMIIVLLISITIFPLLKSSNDSQPIQDDSKTSYLTESSTNAAFRDSSQSSPTTQSKNITKFSPSQKNSETIKSRIDDKHEKEKDIQITSSHCDKEKSKTITNNKDDIQNNVDSNTNKESMNEEVQKMIVLLILLIPMKHYMNKMLKIKKMIKMKLKNILTSFIQILVYG